MVWSLLSFWFGVWFSWNRLSVCSPGWPQAHTNLPVSACGVPPLLAIHVSENMIPQRLVQTSLLHVLWFTDTCGASALCWAASSAFQGPLEMKHLWQMVSFLCLKITGSSSLFSPLSLPGGEKHFKCFFTFDLYLFIWCVCVYVRICVCVCVFALMRIHMPQHTILSFYRVSSGDQTQVFRLGGKHL